MSLRLITLVIALSPLLGITTYAQPTTLFDLVSETEATSEALNVDLAILVEGQVCRGNPTASTDPAEIRRYHAASISKLLTATVIMQLRDEGLLALTDSVGDYVPAFEGSDIEIGHLLTHTSGLRDRRRSDGRDTQSEVDAYIDRLSSQRIRNPGNRWRYADAGFNLLGRVIETVTQRPYEEVMRTRVLRPLLMNLSSFDIEDIPEFERMEAFTNDGEDIAHPWDRAFMPSSGLQTSASDLLNFAGVVLDVANDAPIGLIGRSTLEEMTTPLFETEFEGISQGLGWQLAETDLGPQWRHAGGEAGFESLLTIYPEAQLAMVLLGNQEDWPRFELERSIRELFKSGEFICVND